MIPPPVAVTVIVRGNDLTSAEVFKNDVQK